MWYTSSVLSQQGYATRDLTKQQNMFEVRHLFIRNYFYIKKL